MSRSAQEGISGYRGPVTCSPKTLVMEHLGMGLPLGPQKKYTHQSFNMIGAINSFDNPYHLEPTIPRLCVSWASKIQQNSPAKSNTANTTSALPLSMVKGLGLMYAVDFGARTGFGKFMVDYRYLARGKVI